MFGCFAVALGLLAPRIALVVIFLSTRWLQTAFTSFVWPLLGFVFLPYTTLAMMVANLHGGVWGGWAWFVVLAVLFDLANAGGGGKYWGAERRA